MGGTSCSSPVSQTCKGSARSLSNAGETWLLCEEGTEESVIRCHSSDVYLGISPIKNGGSYISNVSAFVGKTSKTVVNWNN